MCGISAIIDPTVSPSLVSRLLAMHDVIRHRGPDGEGFLAVDDRGVATRTATADRVGAAAAPRVGLAFRRLKICDLTEAAAQPMGSADGRTWVTFDGEIDSCRGLRREREAKGWVFRTSRDTEGVLAAIEE